MLNSPWQIFSQAQLREEIGFDNLILLNDWHAVALAIPHLSSEYLVQVGGTEKPNPSKPMLAAGPGTGFGIASLIINDNLVLL